MNTIEKINATRFWSLVDKAPGHGPEGECWRWKGSIRENRYGAFYVNYRSPTAHRVALGLHLGLWPLPLYNASGDGLVVCHSCHTRDCVNPAHLRLDTQKSNISESKDAGRLAGGSRNGSIKYPEKLKRGEESPVSKLSEKTVVGVRKSYVLAGRQRGTMTAVARKYGISLQHAWAIIHRKVWAHLI